MNKFSERLSQRMEILRLNQSALARRLRTSQSTVNRWLNGSLPRGRMLDDLVNELQVRRAWLVSGEPPMVPLLPDEEELYGELIAEVSNPTDEDKSISRTVAAGARGGVATMRDFEIAEFISDQLDEIVDCDDARHRRSLAYAASYALNELKARLTPFRKTK